MTKVYNFSTVEMNRLSEAVIPRLSCQRVCDALIPSKIGEECSEIDRFGAVNGVDLAGKHFHVVSKTEAFISQNGVSDKWIRALICRGWYSEICPDHIVVGLQVKLEVSQFAQ